MSLDDVVHQRQSEAHPTETPTSTLIDLVKSIKDPNQLAGGDPDPGIRNSDEYTRVPFVITLFGGNDEKSALRGELHRIVQEVEYDPLELFGISLNLRQARRMFESEEQVL